MLYRNVQQQASLLPYNDIYRMLAIMAAVFVPAFLLLRPTRAACPAGH